MRAHTHKLGIADDGAVQILLDKLLAGSSHQERRRQKLLKALEEAAKHYQDSSKKERQAFLHGMLTGYAVALRI
jgi:hypothetical protein